MTKGQENIYINKQLEELLISFIESKPEKEEFLENRVLISTSENEDEVIKTFLIRNSEKIK